jgi:hypothetical protein
LRRGSAVPQVRPENRIKRMALWAATRERKMIEARFSIASKISFSLVAS